MTTNKKSLIIENDKLYAENLLHKNHIKRLQDQNDTLRRDNDVLRRGFETANDYVAAHCLENGEPDDEKAFHKAQAIVQAYHAHRKKVKEIVVKIVAEDHKELLERLAKND